MRVCLVDPRGVHFGLNTGLGYLAAYLVRNSKATEVKVFDFNNNAANIEQRIQEIAGYDIIGFSIKSFTRRAAMEIAGKIKRPGNILLAGGPHISLDGENFLREHPAFSYAIQGEGELPTTELLDALANGRTPTGISGLIRRNGIGVTSEGPSKRITDLDFLPHPDYGLFDSIPDGRIYNYPLVTSRGCPYQCTYCCVCKVMGAKWVARAAAGILDELAAVKQRHNIKFFCIQDDNFSLDMKRAKNICRSLKDVNFNTPWSCPNGIRADKVDEELMAGMAGSGCFAIALGIESAVEKEFKWIKKGEPLSDIVEAIALVKKHGLLVFGNFIIGLPESTLQSTRQSIEFARELKLDSCIFNLLMPFPNTEIWDWVSSNGRMLMDWKDGFTQGRNPKIVFDTPEFPETDRLQAYYEANIRCNNYFALMDEHDGILRNMMNVVGGILRHDAIHTHEHAIWGLKNIKRILGRVVEKNA